MWRRLFDVCRRFGKLYAVPCRAVVYGDRRWGIESRAGSGQYEGKEGNRMSASMRLSLSLLCLVGVAVVLAAEYIGLTLAH